jgi:transcriptional regulator with XRE-family HTH domain
MILQRRHPKHSRVYQTLLQQNVSIQFGCRVRALREQRGWTLKEFAEHVGIDRGLLSDVEGGRMTISLSHIETIAQAFGLSLSEITVEI